jgi:hypothetical protein
MVNMPVECIICGTNKNPSLMISIDTCKDCSNGFRQCKQCFSSSVASSWKDGACPECSYNSATATATASVSVSSRMTNSKPSIIDTLSTLGWVLFALTGLSGLFLLNQDGGGILGVSLIIAGVFQLSIFLGFSAIIDQLYKINVNTSKSDKADS